MNAPAMRQTAGNSFKLLGLVFRYTVGAPLVSFVVSYVAAAWAFMIIAAIGMGTFGLGVGGSFARVLFNVAFAVPGFCGVLAGARCLPQAHRRIGSFALLLLGLIYFCCFVATWGNQVSDEGKTINVDVMWTVRLLFLSMGGFIATVFARGIPPGQSLPPAAVTRED